MKMTKYLNNMCPSDVTSLTRWKLHTSNKISKGIIGSSLKQLARPLLGSTDFTMFPALAGPSFTRLAGRPLACSGGIGVTIFIQGAQLIARVTGWDVIARTILWMTIIDIVDDVR